MQRKPLNRRGKSTRSGQTRQWDAELKEWWVANDMPRYCEIRLPGCMGTFGGALAHSEKRRYILTREQYFEVVFACQKCHDHIDLKLFHDEMKALVKRIINERTGE